MTQKEGTENITYIIITKSLTVGSGGINGLGMGTFYYSYIIFDILSCRKSGIQEIFNDLNHLRK